MSKADNRQELETMTNAYLESGNRISKDASKVTIACTGCGHHQHVALEFALSFGRRCRRCGNKTRIT